MRIHYLATVLLVAASGCEKEDPLFCKMNPGASGCPTADGAIADARPDTLALPDARACFGTGDFQTCLDAAPTGAVALSGTFDTSTTNTMCITTPAAWMAAGQPDACFVVGNSIAIGAALDVTGPRPLVLVAATTVTINANIDVASHRGGKTGPGAPSSLCPAYNPATGKDSTSGGSGGAGGSFLALGGNGGDGNNGGNKGGMATTVVPPPTVLRAGCNGQTGGNGNGGAGAGLRGVGGGALLVTAGVSITLQGGVTINASGAGGAKTSARVAGGGGGGSGGMIVLDAPVITGTGAFLMANGGGGSSGAEDTSNGNGTDGQDPTPGMPMTRALGGNAPGTAGDGGDGWIEGDTSAGNGASGASTRGGGGGGGGGGFIKTTTASGATTSPAATVP